MESAGGGGARDEPRLVMELNTETPIECGSRLILSYAGFKNEEGVAERFAQRSPASHQRWWHTCTYRYILHAGSVHHIKDDSDWRHDEVHTFKGA